RGRLGARPRRERGPPPLAGDPDRPPGSAALLGFSRSCIRPVSVVGGRRSVADEEAVGETALTEDRPAANGVTGALHAPAGLRARRRSCKSRRMGTVGGGY